ncbi:MAG TPA: cytidylate kinase-like family protein [Verrucomicrobiae bacterium]|jgi:cytidylate kinase|nr:cytidylate kinase-like family protein [Verrucomicrobiae bacterium]
MKQILLIDREFGAGGTTIAAMLAQRLGWKLFDDELSQEIARLAKIPLEICRKREERKDPLVHRLINLIWRGSFDRNLPSPDLAILDTDRLVCLIEHVVKKAAETRPCIMVGRGAPYFLRERKDILSIFLYASRELKYHRVLKRVGGNEKEAIEMVDSQDEDRRKFVKHYFGHDWPKRELYHAMFNTGIGDELTVDAILDLLNAVNPKEEAVKT